MALRKIRLMHSAGAKITVVAPKLCDELTSEFGHLIDHKARSFQGSDIKGYRLITAATDDSQVNAEVSRLAQANDTPVNVVDQPELCSFITPSIIDRSPVVVAISTGGSAPVLARLLRSKLEALIPASYGRLAERLHAYRQQIKNRFPEEISRRRFWEDIINGPISEQFLGGQEQTAIEQLEQLIDSSSQPERGGQVCLVGAGPGDPDLLTFRALRLMQMADVILYDRLVSKQVLNLTRRDAERIYVGKRRSDHAVPQEGINQRLIELAQAGNRVVRLKGGDPFIFGRGGEEIEQLAGAGIPFQVVPGISSANGCASYAGIPLTHRDHAQSCLFVTGHLKNGTVDLNWPQLATPNQTVVIYMGLVGLPLICEKLIEYGVPNTMAIALIAQGTTEQQVVVTGVLDTIVERVETSKVRAPTLIIIGSVVSLNKKLAWYDPIPSGS